MKSVINTIQQIKNDKNSSGTYSYRRPMTLLDFKKSGQYNFNNINSLRENELMGNDFLTLKTIESRINEFINLDIKFKDTNQSFYKVNFIQKTQLGLHLAFRIKNYYYTITILQTTLVRRITQNEGNVIFDKDFFNDNYHNNRLVFSENFYLYLSSQIIENNSFKKYNRINIIKLFYSLKEVNFYIIYEGMNIYINGNLDEKSEELYYLIVGNIIYYFNSNLIFTKKQTMEDRDENKKDILYNYQFEYNLDPNFYKENKVSITNDNKISVEYIDTISFREERLINIDNSIKIKVNYIYLYNESILITDDGKVHENNHNINTLFNNNENNRSIQALFNNNENNNNENLNITENINLFIVKKLEQKNIYYNFFLKKFFIIYYGMNVYINENQNENSNELYFIIIDQYNRYYFNKDLVLTKKSLVLDSIFMVLEKHPYKRYNHGNKFEVDRIHSQIIFYYLDRKNEIIKKYNNNSGEINGDNNTRLLPNNKITKQFFYGERIEVNNLYEIEPMEPRLHRRLGLDVTTALYFNFEEDSIFFIFDTEKKQNQQIQSQGKGIQQNQIQQNQGKGNQQNQIQQNIDISKPINIYLSLYNPYIPNYIIIDKKKYYFREINQQDNLIE